MSRDKGVQIDIFTVLSEIYDNKRVITLITLIFFSISLIVSLILPISYSSTTTFIIVKDNNSKNFSNLNFLGFDFNSNNNSDFISPILYSKIVNSSNFKNKLLNSNLNSDSLTLRDYYINQYNISYTRNSSKDKNFITKSEEDLMDLVEENISVKIDDKSGLISITFSSKDPAYSSFISNKSRDLLQEIILNNKIESSKEILNFTENQLKIKQMELTSIQDKLSDFIESNQNVVNSFVINKQKILESEKNIISEVVSELAKQVEQARIQVKKDTPIFTTLQPAETPNIKSKPKRLRIVTSATIIGFFMSLFFSIIKKPTLEIINTFKNIDKN